MSNNFCIQYKNRKNGERKWRKKNGERKMEKEKMKKEKMKKQKMSTVQIIIEGKLVTVDQKDYNETVDRILYFQDYRLKTCPCGILCGFEHSLHRDFLMVYCKFCSQSICDNCIIEIEGKAIHRNCVL